MANSQDVQRLFLQAILSRGIVSGKLAKLLWKKCVAAVNATNDNEDIVYSNDIDAWNAFVTKINQALDSLDLELKRMQDQVSGNEMYTMVNQKGDAIAQMATDYTPLEMSYFKAVVEQIMLAPNESYSVSSMAALREVSFLKSNMTKTAGEDTLGSFVAKGWLIRSLQGRYSLSTRTLLELLPYLKSTYPEEIIECTICMEILTHGIACPTQNCKTRMHNHCLARFRKTKAACPSCSNGWPSDDALTPVGESAAGEDPGRRVRENEGSDDEQQEMDQDEPSRPTQKPKRKPRTTRAKGKGKGKARNNDESEEEEEEDDEEEEEEEAEEEADYEDDGPKNTQKGKRRR